MKTPTLFCLLVCCTWALSGIAQNSGATSYHLVQRKRLKHLKRSIDTNADWSTDRTTFEWKDTFSSRQIDDLFPEIIRTKCSVETDYEAINADPVYRPVRQLFRQFDSSGNTVKETVTKLNRETEMMDTILACSMSYNKFGKRLDSVTYYPQVGTNILFDSVKVYYQYNDRNDTSEVGDFYKKEGKWINYNKRVYTYDEHGRLTRINYFDGETLSRRKTYTLEFKNLLCETEENYNVNWGLRYRHWYELQGNTFDPLTDSLEIYISDTTEWLAIQTNRRISEHGKTTDWLHGSYWQSMNKVFNYYKHYLRYDTNGKPFECGSATRGPESDWQRGYFNKYYYDSEGYLIRLEVYRTLNNGDSSLEEAYNYAYETYEVLVPDTPIISSDLRCNVYPNPASGQQKQYIKVELKGKHDIVFALFSSGGQRLLQESAVFSDLFVWEAPRINMVSGTLLLHIAIDGKWQSILKLQRF